MQWPGTGDEYAADVTKGGEEKIKSRYKKRSQHPESEAQVRIDNQYFHISEAWFTF